MHGGQFHTDDKSVDMVGKSDLVLPRSSILGRVGARTSLSCVPLPPYPGVLSRCACKPPMIGQRARNACPLGIRRWGFGLAFHLVRLSAVSRLGRRLLIGMFLLLPCQPLLSSVADP